MGKLFGILVAFVYLQASVCLAEEISFFDDDGGFFTLTIQGGCYSFQPKLVRTATAAEVETGCFHLFKQSNCEGTQITVRKGSHNLKDLGFDRAVSSVELCSEQGNQSEGLVVSRPLTSHNTPVREMQRDQHTLQDIRDVAVEEHNKYRKLHGVPEVRGNRIMMEDAQKYADQLANSNTFEPTTMGRYGNNIATSFRRDRVDAVRDAIKRWYNKGEGSTKGVVNEETTDIGIGIAWNEKEKVEY